MSTILKRIVIQATVETPALLLSEEQIASAVGDLRERLQRLDLAIITLESTEPPLPPLPEPPADDPWWGIA